MRPLLEIMLSSTRSQKKPLWVISTDAELASDAWTEKAFTDDFLLRSPFPVLGDFNEKTQWISDFHRHYRSELQAGKTSCVDVFKIVSEIQMGAAPEDMLLKLVVDRCDLEAARLNKDQALIFAANMEHYVEEYDGENDFNTYKEWLLDNFDSDDDIVFAEIPCSKRMLLRDIVDDFVFTCGIPDRYSFADLGSLFDENWDKKHVGESLYFGEEFAVCLRMQTRPAPGELRRANKFFRDSLGLTRARESLADVKCHDEHQARVFFHLDLGAGEARSIQRTLEKSARTGRSLGDLRLKMVRKELTYALQLNSLKERFCAILALTVYASEHTIWIDEAKNLKEAERVVKALANVWSTSILCMPDKDLGIVARKGGRCRESLYRLLESASRKFKAATSGRVDFNFLPQPPAPATLMLVAQKKKVQRTLASKKAKKSTHALKQKLSIKGVTDRKGMLTLIKDAHERFEDAKKIKCNFKPIETTKKSHSKSTEYEVKIRISL